MAHHEPATLRKARRVVSLFAAAAETQFEADAERLITIIKGRVADAEAKGLDPMYALGAMLEEVPRDGYFGQTFRRYLLQREGDAPDGADGHSPNNASG